MGPVNKNPKKKKIKILIFECAKLDFCKKKIASAKEKKIDYAFMYVERSVLMSRFQN